MVRVPVRSLVDTFAATTTSTVPFPFPLAPLAIDIQARSDAAVHAQPEAVVTATELDPPVAPNDSPATERVYAHGSGVG